MIYTEYNFKGSSLQEIRTETLFEIATQRAKGTELIKFTFNTLDEELLLKQKNAMKRLMRTTKERGIIQFFAFSEGFSENSTEAMFLRNKYPDIFVETPLEYKGSFFVFVRI